MLALLFAEANWPFALALAVMLGIAVLEGVTSLLGAALSSWLEAALPDWDSPDPELALDDGHALSRFWGWLRLKQVPLLIWLVVFLTAFGLLGLLLQSLIHSVLGWFLPPLLAALVVLLLALPVTRWAAAGLARVMPGDETSVVSNQALIGRVAYITLGTARQGQSAQARCADQHGQNHYVMVEPASSNDVFTQGTAVLLVTCEGALYQAVLADNPHLLK